MASLFLVGLVCNWLIKPVDRAAFVEPAPIVDDVTIPARAVHSMPLRSQIGFIALWVLVGVPLAWGVVTTIDRASELTLSWKLALTLLPLLLGVVVSVGFLNLDKTRFAVTGVSPSYITTVAILFGLYASLLATEVWQKMERTAALNRTEVSALGSVVEIAEGLHPQDRSVRRAASPNCSPSASAPGLMRRTRRKNQFKRFTQSRRITISLPVMPRLMQRSIA